MTDHQRQTAFDLLKQYAFHLFIVCFLFMPLWGFWDTYWFREPREYIWVEHLHAVPAFLWCVLLILQAYWIKTGNVVLHRLGGKLSFILAPLLIMTIAVVSWGSATYAEVTEGTIYIFAVRMYLILSFMLFFGLALWYRKQPQIHARWMICSGNMSRS